jgi:sarcosine oxidase / L-pipecolate oxidase
MTSPPPSYLIIGAGVFGASTAHHLIKNHPNARISLVDRTPYPCPLGASWDWNKVIRADYENIFYAEKALEAMKEWGTDPLFKSFFHRDGMIRIEETGPGRQMIGNYEKLGADMSPEMVPPEEFKGRYTGFFNDADFCGVEEIFVNRKSGWAEAGKALKAVIDFAVSAGVRYIQGEVASLIFEETGACTGVRMRDGSVLKADKIVLSTGAGTAKLLADSAPQKTELQVGNRMTAACVITGIMILDPEEVSGYADIPVGVHAMKSPRGAFLFFADNQLNVSYSMALQER